jgi:hypothetical protein
MTQTALNVSPDPVLELATAFMGSQQLISAARIGLFAALADGPLTSAQLAEATKRSEHQVRILADSMAAHGLLVRTDGSYELTDVARAYLAGDAAELDLTGFLNFLGTISYDQWRGYQKTVDTDAAGVLELDEAGWGEFMAGVSGYNELHAQQFVREFDVAPFKRVLDLGALSPSFSVNLLKANAEATVDFVVDPAFTPAVEGAAAAAGVSDRVTVVGAATESAAPEGEHDLVMVNHVLHRFSVEQNRAILKAARAAAAPGATLLVLDFYLDSDAVPRKLDAVHAGEYYNIDGTFVFPREEVEGWVREAGFEPSELLALPGSPRLLVAKAV